MCCMLLAGAPVASFGQGRDDHKKDPPKEEKVVPKEEKQPKNNDQQRNNDQHKDNNSNKRPPFSFF